MATRAGFLPLVLVALQGCTCGGPKPEPSAATEAGSPSSSATAVAPASPAPADLSVFSAPIAGVRSGGNDVVAGLVATAGVVRVLGLADGKVTFSVDALKDVAWAPDAELRLQASSGGLALLWRGPHAGKSGRTLVLLGPHGEAHEPPVEIGSAFCATDSGVAWLEAHAAGPARVLSRAWTEATARPVTTVAIDRDPALVCGDHDILVLGDGDDDIVASQLTPGEPAAHQPVVLSRDADFGDDDEREHDAYTVGDDLGFVRVGDAGAVALREVPRGGAPTPWRKLKHTIPGDDDVVAVDGDAEFTYVVYTEDADDACPGVGGTAESVHALRVSRRTGEETRLDLAPRDCDRAPGPFWIAPTPGRTTVGWVERRTRPGGGAPPVLGASLRVFAGASPDTRRIEQPSDALVDCGCDARGCSLAALVRPTDGDGMQPGTLRVVPYP